MTRTASTPFVGRGREIRKGKLVKIKQLLPLLAAGLVTVLAVAGLSQAKSSAAPVNTAEPIISGVAKDGNTLTASSGTWTSSTPITYSYQWLRCDAKGLGCANIGGLTVALTGGATAANVSITNAIKGTGAVNIAPSAAAVLVSGAGGKVNVGN